MVTSHDVARLAGVSQPTVSRALNDSPRVSQATKQRVREAAAVLGYSPSAIGRALATGRSNRVGLVVTDLANQFYAHVIAPMHAELERLGHELVLITESSEAGPVPERVAAHGLAGVVLATTTLDSALPARLQDRGVPFVYFNRVAHGVAADAVTADPAAGVAEMAAAVAAAGHRRIAAAFGPRNTSTGEEREQAVREQLAEHGLVLRERDVRHGPFTFEAGREGARELLSRATRPTVLVCAHDIVALGALDAALQLGLDVPGDLSLVGFDDLPPSGWAAVRLSTVGYDLEGMAREAARLVVRRVEEGPAAPPARSTFATHWIPRATLAAPRP